MIDVHAHISALGRNWEGYETATKAAAAGGITTLMGMPLNSVPSTTTLEAVQLEKEQAARESLYVDVGLWGGAVPGNLLSLHALLESPYIFGLKAFLAPLPATAGYDSVTPDQLLDAAKICGPTRKPILVHSELMTYEESRDATEDAYANTEPSSYGAHVRSRPAVWEQDAVRIVCAATRPDPNDESVSCRMHIVHLSDARGCLPIIRACKASLSSSWELTVETCPHYLLLDDTQIQDGDTRVKCFPPIRDAENREALWNGLSDGLVDMVASDHSPCEQHMRMMESKNMKMAWGGLSGLQYQLQATWTSACDRGFTPVEMARWWSENPAKLIGLSNQKGRIAVGQNGDLCWWDPNHKGPPSEYSQEYHRWKGMTVFADNPVLQGRVLGTWVRGDHVYDGIVDTHVQPAGKLLTCS
jgi:allantoinase